MSRVPSYNTLATMNEHNRHGTLDAMARDLHEELRMFDEGAITMTNGQQLCDARRNVKRQLDRVYARANEFDLNVGQPAPEPA